MVKIQRNLGRLVLAEEGYSKAVNVMCLRTHTRFHLCQTGTGDIVGIGTPKLNMKHGMGSEFGINSMTP